MIVFKTRRSKKKRRLGRNGANLGTLISETSCRFLKTKKNKGIRRKKKDKKERLKKIIDIQVPASASTVENVDPYAPLALRKMRF